MPTPLEEFRRQYPQYDDLSDEQLADGLHQQFYSDVPRDTFDALVGTPAPETERERPEAAEQLDAIVTGQREPEDPLEEPTDNELSAFGRMGASAVASTMQSFNDSRVANWIRLGTGRASSLLGDAIRGTVGVPAEALNDALGGGTIVFGSEWGEDDPEDGNFRVRFMRPHELAERDKEENLTYPGILTDTIPNALKDWGEDKGELTGTVDSIKNAYHDGDITGTMGEVMNFGLDQGFRSVPDMVASMSGIPMLATYINARASEMSDEIAENKGKEGADIRDHVQALPAAIGASLFERYGAKKISEAMGVSEADKVGQQVLEAGFKNTTKRLAGKTTKGLAFEGGTEAFQEGVIEYLGTTIGTDAPATWEEGLERGLFGGLAGGVFGGTAGGTAQAGQEVTAVRRPQHIPPEGEELETEEGEPATFPEDEEDPQPTPDPEPEPEPTPEPQPEPVEDETQGDPVPTPGPEPETPPQGTTEPPVDLDPYQAGPDAEYVDVRLKREFFRLNLAGMAEELTEGGGVSYVTDEHGTITGRTPSVNPAWFQSMNEDPDSKMNVRQVRRAVDKAVQGQALGVRQARVVRSMLDEVTGQRTAPENMDWARGQLQEARNDRRKIHDEIAATIGDYQVPVEAYDDTAGELFDEVEYLPDMDAEARIVYELAETLADMGDATGADLALGEAETTADAIRMLEEAIQEESGRQQLRRALDDEQETAEDGPQVAPIEQGPGPQAPAPRAPPETPAETVEEFSLESQSEEQLQQQAEAQRQQREAEEAQRRKAAADAELDEFTLTGSDREADQAAAAGQNTLFSRPPETAPTNPAEQAEATYQDPLTGLQNARALDEDLETAGAVASVNIESLGAINNANAFGRGIGDAVIRATGEALERQADTVDVYRTDGGQFYVLGDDSHQVANAVNRTKKDLGTEMVETGQGGRLRGIRTASGIGSTRENADAAMQTAKGMRRSYGMRARKGELPRGAEVRSQANVYGPRGANYVGQIHPGEDMPLNPNGEYQLGNGRTVRIPKKPVRRTDIMRQLERAFGLKIYQGRVKGKMLGFYRMGSGEIRVKHTNDLEVTAHEFGHWLNDRYPWITKIWKQKDLRKELVGVSYDKELPYEGWAEFMRHFFTREHIARQLAPTAYQRFQEELAQRPELRELVYDVQEQMHAWFLQGVRHRLRDRFGKTKIPLAERFHHAKRRFTDYTLQRYLDDIRSFKRAERAITGDMNVGPAQSSGYGALRLARGAHGVIQYMYYKGTFNWDENGDLAPTGEGLEAVFAPVADRMENMQMYMIARRGLELSEQGRENHLQPDEIAYGLQLGRDDTALAEAFDRWLAFNKRMMDFYQDSGLLSAQARRAMEEMNRNYVPFNRVIDTFNGEEVQAGGSPFMRLQGGTQNINDVFDNIIGNNSRLIHMALINRGKRNFYQMIDRAALEGGDWESAAAQEAGRFATQIPKETKPTKVARDQVIKAVVESQGGTMKQYRLTKESGMGSEEDLALVDMVDRMTEGMEDLVTFFQPQDPKGNVDYYLDGGQKRFYEIGDRLLWDSIQSLGPQKFNLGVSILGGFASTLRTGVTATPTFQARNGIRDTANAFTLSRGHFFPAVGAGKALVERIYNDEHYWEYMLNGGGFASAVEASGMDRDRVLDSPNKMIRTFQRGLAAAEYANRIAEYKALREKGWSKRDAALAGREISTDFAMRGSSEIVRTLTIGTAFLNARLQGLYRNGREVMAMNEGKGRFLAGQAFSYALRSTIGITIPSVLLYLLNRDDERYQEMPDHMKDLGWIIFTGDGEDDYVVLPKPFETGMAWGTLPERSMELALEENSKEFGDALQWMFLQTFGLGYPLTALTTWRELQANEDWRGYPIIPQYLEGDVAPEEQYQHHTSAAMVALGRKTGMSPLKAEHMVQGYLGTWGNYLLAMGDNMAYDAVHGGERPTKHWKDSVLMSGFTNHGPLRRTKSEQVFYDMLQDSRTVANTMRLISNRDPERIEGYISDERRQVLRALNRELEQIQDQVSGINSAMDQIRQSPDMSGDEKRRQIDQLQRDQNDLLRAVRQNINYEVLEEATEDLADAETQP